MGVRTPGLERQPQPREEGPQQRKDVRPVRKQQLPEKAEWHRQERGFGGFERVIEMPVSMDSSKVEAHFENGVLTIKMCKSPQAKPRKITVKSE